MAAPKVFQKLKFLEGGILLETGDRLTDAMTG